MLGYSYYTFHTKGVDFKTYDSWFISISSILGFMLLITGSTHVDRLAEKIISLFDLVINRFKK